MAVWVLLSDTKNVKNVKAESVSCCSVWVRVRRSGIRLVGLPLTFVGGALSASASGGHLGCQPSPSPKQPNFS